MPNRRGFLSGVLTNINNVSRTLLIITYSSNIVTRAHRRLTVLRLANGPVLAITLAGTSHISRTHIGRIRHRMGRILQRCNFTRTGLFVATTARNQKVSTLHRRLLRLPKHRRTDRRDFHLTVSHTFAMGNTKLIIANATLDKRIGMNSSL